MNNWRKIFSWEESDAVEADPLSAKSVPKEWGYYTAYLTYPEEGIEEIDIYAKNLESARLFAQAFAQENYEPGYTKLVVKSRGPGFLIGSQSNLKLAWEELTEEEELKIKILHAIYCAEAVLPIYENKYPNDNRPRLAIEAAKIALKYPTEENKAKARASASAAYYATAWVATASAASAAAWVASARAASGAAYAADAIMYAIKYAKKAAKEANIDIDFDSLLSKAQSDIWEYINISEASNTSKTSLKLAWDDDAPLYKAIGFVYGSLWDGNEGSYPSIQLEGFSSIEALIEGANKKLEDKSLDSGMGFADLKGAILYPLKTIGAYYKEPLEPIFIGSLTEREKRFLASL